MMFSGGSFLVNKFHEIVAAIEAIALRLSTLILLLAALFVFVRQALGL
jgi:hypothetical protein